MAVGAAIAFLSGVTFTLFPAVLSPKPRVVALVLFACGVISDLAQLGYFARFEYMRPRLPLAASMVGAEALGGVLAVFLVWRLAARANPHKPIVSATADTIGPTLKTDM